MTRIAAFLLMLICAALSACVLIPAPTLALLPLTIAVPELSPWLTLFGLLGCAITLRFHRRIVPVMLVSTLILAWPATQAARTYGVRVLFRGVRADAIEAEKLPMGILHYPGRGPGLRPGLIEIYGGAWQRGSPADNRRFDQYMATRGYSVFAIEYRHAPAAHFPAQLEDVREALRFIHSAAAQYATDPDRLALCGRSSGGQLALLAAYEGGPVPVRAVIALYAPTDPFHGYQDVPTPDPIDVRKVLETYIGGTPTTAPELYRAASAITYADQRVPPTLLIQGGRDHLVPPKFARNLASRLRAAGNRVVLLELPWADHFFDGVFSGIGNRIALECIEQFLAESLG